MPIERLYQFWTSQKVFGIKCLNQHKIAIGQGIDGKLHYIKKCTLICDYVWQV